MTAPQSRRVTPRVIAACAAMMLGVVTVGAWGAAPASAASYRFWTYWSGGAEWTFANQGAARRPADGAVEGWRFAVSEASSSASPPRHTPSFAELCGGTPAVSGSKRVGLVVDFGTTSDAPSGETPHPLVATCAVVPADATGYAIVSTVAQLRIEGGLVCGIDGYPVSECGVVVADPEPSPTTTQQSGGGGGGADDPDRSHSSTPTSSPESAGTTTPGQAKNPRDTSGPRDDAPRDRQTAPATITQETAVVAAPVSTSSPHAGSPTGALVAVALVGGLSVGALAFRRRRR